MDPEMKEQAMRRINLTLALTDKKHEIPFKGGRPLRPDGIEGHINKDDILNLKILLNTCNDWDDFFYKS